MTEKELKKLSRAELLKLLLEEAEKNETLSAQVRDLKAQLAERMLAVEKAGSIAEASLQLNGVFEAAQAAAEQYLENVRTLSGRQEAVCRQMEAEARKKAEAMALQAKSYQQKTKEEADTYRQKTKEEADAYRQKTKEGANAYRQKVKEEADACRQKAKEEADAYWAQVSKKVEELVNGEESLFRLIREKKENGRP